MSYIHTTIWELVDHVLREVDEVAEGPEAEILGVAAVADLLHRAHLTDEVVSGPAPRRPLARDARGTSLDLAV